MKELPIICFGYLQIMDLYLVDCNLHLHHIVDTFLIKTVGSFFEYFECELHSGR